MVAPEEAGGGDVAAGDARAPRRRRHFEAAGHGELVAESRNIIPNQCKHTERLKRKGRRN